MEFVEKTPLADKNLFPPGGDKKPQFAAATVAFFAFLRDGGWKVVAFLCLL